MDSVITEFRSVFGLILNSVCDRKPENAMEIFQSSSVSKAWNRAVEKWAGSLYTTLQKEHPKIAGDTEFSRRQLITVLLAITEGFDAQKIWQSKLNKYFIDNYPICLSKNEVPIPEASVKEIFEFFKNRQKMTKCPHHRLCPLYDPNYIKFYFNKLGLKFIPRILNALPSTGFFLQTNQITKLPSYIDYPEVNYLYLDKNLLTNLPKNINEKIPDLRALSLINNRFKIFPNFHHKNLLSLDLSNNLITKIPDADWLLNSFPLLNNLKLNNNNIDDDPANRRNLQTLAEKKPQLKVDYSGNPICNDSPNKRKKN